MGFHMFVFRKGQIREATIIGIILILAAVIFGRTFAESSYGHYLVLTRHQVTAAMAIYAFAASVLPMWMLLTPRGYLSTFMKIGTIAFLALGVIIVNPTLQAPAFSQFIARRRSDHSGPAVSRSSSSRSRAAPSRASTR